MSGEVEADETFIGGKARFMHASAKRRKLGGKGGGSVGKVAVMGLLERHGEVRTVIVPGVGKQAVQPEVRKHVEPGSYLYTDVNYGYVGLDAEYIHQVINHAEAYVRGRVHTNGLECFWALTKRVIKGSYVSVEPFHLFRYLDEEEFRYNRRRLSDAERFVQVICGIDGKRLGYAQLIGEPSA